MDMGKGMLGIPPGIPGMAAGIPGAEGHAVG